ncbi:hypothetical protein ACFVH6_42140 [Spirillospora sp. NPDC127200]
MGIPPREHVLLADILVDAVLAQRPEETAERAAGRLAAGFVMPNRDLCRRRGRAVGP